MKRLLLGAFLFAASTLTFAQGNFAGGGSSLPKPTLNGQCVVSNVSLQWVAGSCSGSASANFSTLVADSANISGGTFTVGDASHATTITFAGIGQINASQYKGNNTPTAGEFGFLSGVTSAIQTQLNAMVPNTRTVAGKQLNSNITLAQSDLTQGNVAIGAFYMDLSEIAAPANPSASTCRLSIDSTAHTARLVNSTGAACWPTFNQNTTGSAAKWTAARSLAGNSVDGSADVPFTNKFIAQGTADAGLSNAQFLGNLATGLLKNTTTTGVLSVATGADIDALYSGAGKCYLFKGTTPGTNDGCDNPTGSGNTTSTSLTTNRLPKANGANSIVDSGVIDDGSTLTYSGSGGISVAAITVTGTAGGDNYTEITAPGSPGAGTLNAWADSTDHRLHDKNSSGIVGTTVVPQSCTNQALTALANAGTLSCTTLTSAYVDNTIAKTGTDINTSNQVTALHLTGTGLARNNGSVAELSGAVVTSASNATTAGKTDVLQASSSCADAGATDAYACNLSPAVTAYVTGTHYRFKANTANTGTASINFNGVGALTIVKLQGAITTVLADNDIRAGQWVECVYDGTNCQMMSALGNAPAGSGTVNSGTAGNLAGYSGTGTAVSDVGVATANLVTAAANFVSGSLVQGAGANKTTSDSGVVAANVVTQTSNASSGQICAYTGTNKVCVPTTTLPTAAIPTFTGGDVTSAGATATLTASANIKTRAIAFNFGTPEGSALSTGLVRYFEVPFACTISGYWVAADAGTATIKFWKVASGTALPTVSNVISTSGVALSSGTIVISSTTSDFTTTTVTAGDIIAATDTAVATAKWLQAGLKCGQ